MTNRYRNRSSQVMCGSSGQKNLEAAEYLEKCLCLLEDLVYDASGMEEAFNPSEYAIPAEIVQRANQILTDLESCSDIPSDPDGELEAGYEKGLILISPNSIL